MCRNRRLLVKIFQVKRVEIKLGQEGSDFKICGKLDLKEIGVMLDVGDKEWKRKETTRRSLTSSVIGIFHLLSWGI